MHLDLTDLKLFVEIAETGNLTRGAQRVFLSAPAASARVRAMELRLATQLLRRENKGVTLTSAGERLLHHARLIRRQYDFLHDDLRDDFGGQVRVFANTTAVTEFLPEVLAGFLADRPGVSIDLQERLTDDIIRAVLNGGADLGIISGQIDTQGLESIPFSTDRLVLAAPIGHALTRPGTLSFSDTLNHEHISLHEGSTLLAFLRGQMDRHGYTRSVRLQVRSFEAMCRLIEAGVGIGVVPESAALRHAKTMQISLVELTDDWAIRTRAVLARSRAALPRSANALVDEIVRAGLGGSGVRPKSAPVSEAKG